MNKQNIADFIAQNENGVNEEQICKKYPEMTVIELANQLNALIKANQVEISNENNVIFYKPIINKTLDYEAMVLALLAKQGSSGLWLRDIKLKTNIPHNLILKILKNLEANRKIKSIKSVKNNRRTYILYDIKPDEDVTGGVWFNNNDVDLIFVNRLLEIIYKFVSRKEDTFYLNKIDSLVKLSELYDFIVLSKISEVPLTIQDLNTLIDCLIFDGKLEKYVLDDGIALRTLKDEYLQF